VEAAARVPGFSRDAVRALAPDALGIMEAFAIPDVLLHAPIALDWQLYNESDNKGEVYNLKSKL